MCLYVSDEFRRKCQFNVSLFSEFNYQLGTEKKKNTNTIDDKGNLEF